LYYLDLNLSQINKYAENALRDFDAERLRIPKPLDAFDFTELHLGLTADPQRLTPNLQVYGLMAFNDGYWWVWPNEEEQKAGIEQPHKHNVEKGTFLIDDRMLYDISVVSMIVYQPRLEHISDETMFVEALYQWADEVLKPASELAWNGEGEFQSGAHCQFCKAKQTCRKRAEENLALATAKL
jgi:hypothetical protein